MQSSATLLWTQRYDACILVIFLIMVPCMYHRHLPHHGLAVHSGTLGTNTRLHPVWESSFDERSQQRARDNKSEEQKRLTDETQTDIVLTCRLSASSSSSSSAESFAVLTEDEFQRACKAHRTIQTLKQDAPNTFLSPPTNEDIFSDDVKLSNDVGLQVVSGRAAYLEAFIVARQAMMSPLVPFEVTGLVQCDFTSTVSGVRVSGVYRCGSAVVAEVPRWSYLDSPRTRLTDGVS